MSIEQSFITDTPRITDVIIDNSIVRTYLWDTGDKRNVFLYLTLTPKQSDQNGSYLIARANLDSSDIKGQGVHLWQFLKSQLKSISHKGIKDVPPVPVLHEVRPNIYSRKIIEQDTDYIRKGDLFYCLYSPQTAPTQNLVY